MPDMHTWLFVKGLDCTLGSDDKAIRKDMLSVYRHEVVYPAAAAFDQGNFTRAVASHEWPYASFGGSVASSSHLLTRCRWDSSTWQHFRVWSAARCTGRFPLPLLGFDFFPRSFACCPLCSSSAADLAHAVCSCIGTGELRRLHNVPSRPWDALRSWIFDLTAALKGDGSLSARVLFFAEVVLAVAEGLHLSHDDVADLLDGVAST